MTLETFKVNAIIIRCEVHHKGMSVIHLRDVNIVRDLICNCSFEQAIELFETIKQNILGSMEWTIEKSIHNEYTLLDYDSTLF